MSLLPITNSQAIISSSVLKMNNDNCYITCAGRNDGVGAQVHGILSTMLFCKEMRINYVHSPFGAIAHKPKGESDWENDWEKFFNIGKGETEMDGISSLGLNVVEIKDRTKLPTESQPSTLFVVPHCHEYTDTVPNNYLKIRRGFLEKYQGTSKEKYQSYNHSHTINIAVHIRRGDVSQAKYPGRFTNNIFIVQLLANIQYTLAELDKDISINIFSEGDIDDFKELKADNVHFYLNHCLFTTFCNLVDADILVMGKSSFSYTAALFSNSVKMYGPFWHQPLNDWVTVNEFAKFDTADFKNKVSDKLVERGLLKPRPNKHKHNLISV